MKLRNLVAAATAAIVAVSAMAVSAFAADATGPDGLAGIVFASTDWTAQNWINDQEYASVAENVTITGNGTYTVSVKAVTAVESEETGEMVETEGATGIAFAALQVVNGETLFPGMVITIDSVELDGVAVALSGTPYTSSDENITTRVNLYNEWVSNLPDDARTVGGLAADATPTAIASVKDNQWTTMKVTFTVSGIEEGGAAPADPDKGSPDTGVAGIAAVAGLAVVAGGVMAASRKRK
ncbi:MAG: NPXTG-anchored protein [Oscillospiraceae bacterium]